MDPDCRQAIRSDLAAAVDSSSDRYWQLLEVTSTLSRALSLDGVADVVITQAVKVFGAAAGIVEVLAADGGSLQVIASTGYEPDTLEPLRDIPLHSPVPLAVVVRENRALWLESGAEWDGQFPFMVEVRARSGLEATVALPLSLDGPPFGVIGLSFDRPRSFAEDEYRFMAALARECAHALDRVLTYQAEQRAREQVRLEQDRFYTLFRQAPALVAISQGPEHVLVFVNEALERLQPDRTMVGVPFAEAFPEMAAGEFIELMDTVYRSGEPFVGREVPMEMGTRGTVLYLNLVTQPTRDANGEIDGLMSHAVDVTEQVQGRREVEALAAERAVVLGQMADGLVISDPDGTLIYANEAAHRMTGAEGLGRSLASTMGKWHVMTPEGEPYPVEDMPLARALRGEVVTDGVWHLIGDDGLVLAVEGSAAPLSTPDGRMLGAVSIFRDVTERYQLNRNKEEFLSAVAHDIKTPLTVVRGTAQIARNRLRREAEPDVGRLLQDLEQIESMAVRMAGMVDSLLDLSSLQMEGGSTLHREMVELGEMAGRVVTLWQRRTDWHRFELECPQPVLGRWDAGRLEVVLNNLVTNAVRYSPMGGTIRVSVGKDEDTAVIAVRDEGIGMTADEVPHIFERFYRGAGAKRVAEGAGIGLAVVRQLVDQHGGRVAVDTIEGRGSTFTVYLPLSATSDSR